LVEIRVQYFFGSMKHLNEANGDKVRGGSPIIDRCHQEMQLVQLAQAARK